MAIKAIKTNDDYLVALNMLEDLMVSNPNPDSEDGHKLDILAILVENYENENFPVDSPNAIEAIKFRVDQLNLKPCQCLFLLDYSLTLGLCLKVGALKST